MTHVETARAKSLSERKQMIYHFLKPFIQIMKGAV